MVVLLSSQHDRTYSLQTSVDFTKYKALDYFFWHIQKLFTILTLTDNIQYCEAQLQTVVMILLQIPCSNHLMVVM